jgi:simple sugar transport system permease protein
MAEPRLARTAESFLIPVAAILLALGVFGVFLAVAGADPLAVFRSIHRGGFGTWYSWQNTLTLSAALMLTALCTALPARVGLVVIGGEGALVVGGLAAALTGLAFAGQTPALVISIMALTGMLTGGLWIAAGAAQRH